MLHHHRIKRVAITMWKMGVASALAAMFALAPLRPILAQDSGSSTRHAQGLGNRPESAKESSVATSSSSVKLQEPGNKLDGSKLNPPTKEQSSAPDASTDQATRTPPVHPAAGPNDADPTFVSQIQAANKSPQLKADESSGALNYSYPLDVPPGRNGLHPDLMLSYNSQTLEDGSIFGYGWLINIPTIQRKNTHGTDKLYSRFDFTSALSGDLVATDTSNSTFSARVDDGENLKYSLYPDQAWTVRNKQGLTYIFGASAAERQDDPADPDHLYTWLLSSISDPNGNTITYTYYKDRGQVYPASISYGGIYEISFSRAARQDTYHGYRTGFSVTSAYVVSKIQVKVSGSVAKSYILTYSNNPTTGRSRLQSIAVQDATHTYPPTTFAYQLESAKGFDATWSSASVPVDLKNGVLPVDVTGDGYPDLIKAYEWTYAYYSSDKSISIYNPESNSWQIDPVWQLPASVMIDTDGAYNRNTDSGTRVVDLNGDLKPDFLRYQNFCFICTTDQQVSTGLGWSATPNWFSPINTNGGTRTVLDLNGDGLTDVFGTNGVFPYGTDIQFQTSVSLNNGSDFTTYGRYSSAPPDPSKPFTSAPYFLSNYLSVDVNGDGLPDLIKSSWYYGYPNSTWDKKIYLNTGSGWVEDPTWTFPDVCYFCQGSAGQGYNTIYFQDINNDGYVDFVVPGGANVNNQQLSYSNVYINNGHGWAEDTGWYSLAYFYSDNCFCQNPALFFDGNADGAQDIYVSNGNNLVPSTNIFTNKNRNQIDLLSTVTLPYGGTISVTYKPSTQYHDAAGHLLNPKLPLMIQTVEKITADDKNGNVAATTYSYADGSYYYNGPFDHKFAGFGSITTTDAAGNVSKTYLHQGNESNEALGEYNDEYCKIGKSYRQESYDGSGHLYSLTISKWDGSDLVSGGRFVKLAQTLGFVYDGNSTHREKAETYVYDDSTSNLIQKTTWGEVTGNNDGSFTDIGTDTYTTTISYATGSGLNVVGLPAQAVVIDQNANKVKETRYYYDDLSLGSVDKGNVTREENWKSGTDYINTTKTYNQLGLVIATTDPRGYVTNYTYDAFDLYPAVITNALNQSTQFSYDYASGKVKQKIDANGHIFQTGYDGSGRVIEERQPDLENPTQLVLRTSYLYTDIAVGSSVKRTDYLDARTSLVTYTYYDGLGRTTQTRKQAEAANTFAVSDVRYNGLGLVQQQSLPYFSSGAMLTSATTDAALYITFSYDPLHRNSSTTTADGTTTNMYDDWKLTITDANGKQKDLYKDAYDRLVQVGEHDRANTYTTKYSYDGLSDLVKLTDAGGNVRGFSYDGLGRRTVAEDLHAPADTTFGAWSYDYDDSGNLIARVDGNGQMTGYEYDELSRLVLETGDDSRISYRYDNCPIGIGRLCAVESDALVQENEYNPLGVIKIERKSIDGVEYLTRYGYDRQGHLTLLTNPDDSEVKYQYNAAGLLEQVLLKEAGAASYASVITGIDYSPLEEITSLAYANGATTTNTYDSKKLYRLTRKVTLLPVAAGAGRLAQDLSYSYDNVGNILKIVDASETDTRKTSTFTYDDLYRVLSTSVTDANNQQIYWETYSYDPIGNISSKIGMGYNWTYAYTGNLNDNYANPHAVTTIKQQRFLQTLYSYDRNGNLISIKGGASFIWDHNNRLTQIIASGNPISYTYDQAGQRIKSANTNTTVIYPSRFYNISRATNLQSEAGSRRPVTVSIKHIFVGGELVATVSGSSGGAVIHSVHTDHLTGSNVISNMSGQIEELMDYYPYGALRLDESQSGFSEQRKFAGYEYDVDTGLNYANARYYNPAIGRFISQDPVFLALGNDEQIRQLIGQPLRAVLGDPQNLNAYTYARNNPIINTDPSGLFSLNPINLFSYNTQVAIGNWANNLYQNHAAARLALDHPYAAGAAIGVAGGAVVAGGVVAGGGAITCGLLCGPGAASTVIAGSGACASGVCQKAQVLVNQAQGLAGEVSSGIEKNTQSIIVNGNTRIPDILDPANKVIGEVKTVQYQSLTSQLRDFMTYAQDKGYQFKLIVDNSTKLSGSLQEAVNTGKISLTRMPLK
jgi:RHS repeat-associated protein